MCQNVTRFGVLDLFGDFHKVCASVQSGSAGGFPAGFGVAGYISHDLLFRHAREQVLAEARLVMEAALAIRGHRRPRCARTDPIMHEQFLPQTVPAYAATETLAELRKNTQLQLQGSHPQPDQPRDRASDWGGRPGPELPQPPRQQGDHRPA